MSHVVIELKPTAALFSDPKSEKAKFQNLLLNIMGNLKLCDLSEDERNLLIKNGYKGSFE